MIHKLPTYHSQMNEDIVADLGFAEYVKLPVPVKAAKIRWEFRVDTLEGDYKQGKPGDYLMVGIDNELYICDNKIFNKTYVKLNLKTVFVMIKEIIKAYINQR